MSPPRWAKKYWANRKSTKVAGFYLVKFWLVDRFWPDSLTKNWIELHYTAKPATVGSDGKILNDPNRPVRHLRHMSDAHTHWYFLRDLHRIVKKTEPYQHLALQPSNRVPVKKNIPAGTREISQA